MESLPLIHPAHGIPSLYEAADSVAGGRASRDRLFGSAFLPSNMDDCCTYGAMPSIAEACEASNRR